MCTILKINCETIKQRVISSGLLAALANIWLISNTHTHTLDVLLNIEKKLK